MTINDLVKSLGVPEDKADDAVHKVKDFLDGDYVTKARFNEVNESKKALSEQIADRDKQLTGLKKNADDNQEPK